MPPSDQTAPVGAAVGSGVELPKATPDRATATPHRAADGSVDGPGRAVDGSVEGRAVDSSVEGSVRRLTDYSCIDDRRTNVSLVTLRTR